MSERSYEATLERHYAASRFAVWGLVSDTNRWDRASGLTPGRYSWQDEDGRRVRVGTARELGFDIEWVEPPYEWIEGRFVQGERSFRKGPLTRGGFRARLRDAEGGGTRVTAVSYVAGDGALMHAVGPIMRSKFRRALGRYLDGIGELLSEAPAVSDDDAPPSLVARDLLSRHAYEPVTLGPRSETSMEEIKRRAARLADTPLPRPLVERLTSALAERSDEELAQMRPFELADRWGVDRRELLRVFLHATRAGLVDLRWQINCPVCRVAAQVVGTLQDVSGAVHCAACNIGYKVDFGAHVEAVFQCHPAIRQVETSVFCASSPAFLPHVLAQLSVPPQATRRELADLRPGSLHLRTLSGSGIANVRLAEGCSLHVVVDGDDLRAESVPSGDAGEIVLESTDDAPRVVLLERADFDSAACLGSAVASFPDFLDLFATEAPAAGVELTIAHLALLFSDLTGSTALYGKIGDARAFAIVQEHFREMSDIVDEHRGAVVKTMGDAVMASFASESDAVAAGLAMLTRCRERHGELGLSAKIGVSAGACLAVRANERLDFFGTTVNLAARLQGLAKGGQLVISEDLATHSRVQSLIQPFAKAPFRSALKGIVDEQNLIRIDVAS